jgi:hypothetical protein
MKEKSVPKDRKASALGTNRVFLRIIDTARWEIRAGEVISLEEIGTES